MTNQYVPLLFLAAIGAGFAVFSVVAGALAGPEALQPRQARGL